ncbi:phage integrase SAM-like domain-containing protein [Gramella sp. AN32]|uniref:Phage integrase SAM-like domain-containing protein n=1 Tax=Christiangramia antarctica TaxID=2058158 RepID=A0ABW5X501_9FLAO|nr:phage integrase SAM-like domain-containing protein [Gramella sp. AN32]MCM4154749.1 hypothetical protein [Gramella sp. AN32]
MTISFYIQSSKNPAPIYVRVREGRDVDAKCKIQTTIDPKLFSKGKIKLRKIPTGADANAKDWIQKANNELILIQKKLDQLKVLLNERLNNRKNGQTINSQWLNEVIYPRSKNEIPKALLSYFDYFLESKKTSLNATTIKKIKVFKHRLERYEKTHGIVYINEVDKRFALSLQRWCDRENYAHNTKVKTLKVLLTVCNHAKENGILTSTQLPYITRGLKYQKTSHVHLNFEELKKIAATPMPDQRLENARDWLIISCFTAQRVSDFLRFSKNKIVEMEGMQFLDISQKKTGKALYIPLTKEVTEILDKRGGEFPPAFSDHLEGNKTIYNTLIKEVCRVAKINNKVTSHGKNPKTNRYEFREVPKYKAVSTHIGRRSFATNYYGKINTALLINATGHSSETQFLKYVGKDGNQQALTLAKAMKSFAEQSK